MEQEISAHLLRLRRAHPFLATLSLFAEYVFTERVPAFATDGRTVHVNPTLFKQLPADQRTGLLVHVTLHAALLHVQRRGVREPQVWNIAADIVVNNLILEAGAFQPPAGTAVEPKYASLSVEQLYEELMTLPPKNPSLRAVARSMTQAGGSEPATPEDQVESPPVPAEGPFSNQVSGIAPAFSNDSETGQAQGPQQSTKQGSRPQLAHPQQPGGARQQHAQGSQHSPSTRQDAAHSGFAAANGPGGNSIRQPNTRSTSADGQSSLTREQIAFAIAQRYAAQLDLVSGDAEPGRPSDAQKDATIRQHWRAAFNRAEAVARLAKQQGELPAGLQREIQALFAPTLDWRTLLWRHVAHTPCDYAGFDRRFIHMGLYLDQLQHESLRVRVAIDTSGSISTRELDQFASELQGIRGAYHFIDIDLYYIDAEVHGPYPMRDDTSLPPAHGGGGTDFTALFTKLHRDEPDRNDVLVYLTDGHGSFPKRAPQYEVLWVVSNGGLKSEAFPFGEVARLAVE